MKAIEVFTDGACRGNPGPGGWGVLLIIDGKESSLFGGEKDTTNNRMELTAAIKALEVFKQESKLSLTTDSTYVKDGITKWLDNWKVKNWVTASKKPVKNKDLWIKLDQLNARHKVSWKWVKAHVGHRENEIADMLANKGIDEL
ncbi:ribonuclease HI [Gammaproteobacteria bacterium]|nr:ribonuclease HI [SAR86 cluster bacterium]MDB3976090.1 ribonuclease HI [Gammaproteobacteria bacterium]MDB4815818.1 ribonuclease HI [Gammaproteobacteria bacterium]MDC0509643.1 ribonuclease HI [Gammaproteobacteria bacterium]MDC0577914.1 ribonuclease HI [Gammaproteobacteria bacterium]